LAAFAALPAVENHLGSALRPRELIGRIATDPPIPEPAPSFPAESGKGQRDLRRQIGHWKAGRNERRRSRRARTQDFRASPAAILATRRSPRTP